MTAEMGPGEAHEVAVSAQQHLRAAPARGPRLTPQSLPPLLR